ncbi:hypothetical protein HGM15179_002120 [Zosterops borbonicus]|uniref:MAM domain-containing protein n=1 Tax=Zosterops borbonicus TaxID=364589 RepID=A0A8K1GXC5_9PASS|nr:hypothetical protein HGM15179_002120 [Zosterops borbonicus]
MLIQFLSGCCTFDEPLSSCGYSQSDDDDLNWDQVNAPVKPSSGQGIPSEDRQELHERSGKSFLSKPEYSQSNLEDKLTAEGNPM